MNSLFIYLFFEIVASRWFNGYIGAITNSLMGYINTPELFQNVMTSLIIFALEWGCVIFCIVKRYSLKFKGLAFHSRKFFTTVFALFYGINNTIS